MTHVVPRRAFPTALVTESRLKYWRAQWVTQLTMEMHKRVPNAEIITRCEEHIAMASLALEAIR